MSEMIVTSARMVRQLVLQQVEAIPEEQWDLQPDKFNNTIRWNVGHIVFWMDAYLKLCFQADSEIPTSYAALFNSGTKPADWTAEPPSKEELLQELSRQLGRISEIAPVSLEAKLEPPLQFGPLTFRLAGELLNFGVVHESMHLETCSSIKKLI